jgi:UDP-3-O-[3-hydroxymyristoyl] glucosamine N-acyltransferase
MEFSAQAIASFLQGEINGDPAATVNTVCKIEEGVKGGLAFLANPKYEKHIYDSEASVVIVNKSFVPERPVKTTLIRVDDAYNAFATLLEMYNAAKLQKTGIEQPSYIASSAKIGKDPYVGAFAYIGENAVIGDNVKIYPQAYVGDNVVIKDNTMIFQGVKIYHECLIGAECVIHAGAVIGADGFGFASQADKNYRKVPQVGNVILEDRVEIGANTTVDRATMGSTIIRRGVKLDNLIQVAHNVEIGENTVIAAQTGIAGSTKIGKECMIAGQVGIVGHLTIADEVKVAAQSGVSNDVKNKGEILLGSPAFNIFENRKSLAVFRRLPDLRNQIIALERSLKEVRDQLAAK